MQLSGKIGLRKKITRMITKKEVVLEPGQEVQLDLPQQNWPTPMEEDRPEQDLIFVPGAYNRPRHRREPSVVDLTPLYNIAEDLLNQRANATYSQLLQVPKQRQNLSYALWCPLITIAEETNLAEPTPST